MSKVPMLLSPPWCRSLFLCATCLFRKLKWPFCVKPVIAVESRDLLMAYWHPQEETGRGETSLHAALIFPLVSLAGWGRAETLGPDKQPMWRYQSRWRERLVLPVECGNHKLAWHVDYRCFTADEDRLEIIAPCGNTLWLLFLPASGASVNSF